MISIDHIRHFIQHDLLNDPSRTIAPDQDLLLSGLLDSLNVVRLAIHLETVCSITIPPEDVVLEHFGTLEQIAAYVAARMA